MPKFFRLTEQGRDRAGAKPWVDGSRAQPPQSVFSCKVEVLFRSTTFLREYTGQTFFSGRVT